MLTLEKLRKIDEDLRYLSDEELIKIRDSYYELGQIIFDDWVDNKFSSKNPIRQFYNKMKGDKI